MIKETIKFKDAFGEEHEEDHWFNLSRAEIIERELNEINGEYEDLQARIDRIIGDKIGKDILAEFKVILAKSYGIRDGKYFRKGPELFKNFEESGAYDELFMHLVTDADFAARFINGIKPDNIEELPNGADTSAAARARSEASMQGYNKPQERVQTIQTPAEVPAQAPTPVVATEFTPGNTGSVAPASPSEEERAAARKTLGLN